MKLIYYLIAVLVILAVIWFVLKRFFVSSDVSYVEWTIFVLVSICSLLVISLGAFCFYCFYYYKSIKLKEPSDVFKLRKPWVKTMLLVLPIQSIICFVIGLAIIPEKTIFSILGLILFALFEGVFGMLIFWITSLFLDMFLPKRVKYIPFLRFEWR